MKNYIIFYAAIIVFVIGGIKWTSYVIEKERKEKVERTNYHQQVTSLLLSGGEVSPTETLNKNIVLYVGYIGLNNNKEDILKLNELKNKYSSNTVFYMLSKNNKESTEDFLSKNKLRPDFKIVYKPRMLFDYINSLMNDFPLYSTNPAFVVVISYAGKVKLYKWSGEKAIMSQIETAIK